MRCGPPMCPVDKLLSLKDVGSSFWPPGCMMVLRPCTIETYAGNITYASAQALVSHPWRPSYYRSDRSTMPMSDTIILRSSSTLSLRSPYIRISSNFFQAVANTIPFFFLFLAMLACSWRVSRIAHFVVLTLFGESITRKVRIPIKRFW